MKRKIRNFIILNKRWGFVVTYMIFIISVLLNRERLIYAHIPFIENIPPSVISVLNTILLLLSLVGLICLVKQIRCPFWHKRKVRIACERAEIETGKGEVPELISVRINPDRKHGLIYKIKNYGIPIESFDKKISELEASLKSKIYNLEIGKNYSHILLPVVPFRYVKPSAILLKDDAIGSASCRELISALIIGKPGSGKTVCTKILIKKLIDLHSTATSVNAQFYVLDYKQINYSFLKGNSLYYAGDDCLAGFNDYFTAYEEQRKTTKPSDIPCYLIVDEWGGFLMSLDRTTRAEVLHKAYRLTALGRESNYFPIFCIQRPDSKFLDSARDNFSCIIALGNLSPEGKRMVAGDEKDQLCVRNKKREGYLMFEGHEIERIKVENIPDISALDCEIKRALVSGEGGGEAER